jgi:hypothetical protein
VEMVWFGGMCGVSVLDNVLYDVPKVEAMLRVEGWSWRNF